MNTDKKFALSSIQDSETICKYLDEVKEGFQKGNIQFSYQGNSVKLTPHGLVKFEIKARHKEGQVKLTLRFRWEENEEKRFMLSSDEQTRLMSQDE
ncbi:amphi-Trp domain-containing protein [Desulfonatronovibrio magnus]|uniref:amphi-Trp domain-containing protein n=1 Tax=Desulfonatronovibrio magnus TaxID=698827 RepID=UPI0005EACBC4|nr:amphi-Trp domain-containing protein [Desulfonatronovibrio magnus]